MITLEVIYSVFSEFNLIAWTELNKLEETEDDNTNT